MGNGEKKAPCGRSRKEFGNSKTKAFCCVTSRSSTGLDGDVAKKPFGKNGLSMGEDARECRKKRKGFIYFILFYFILFYFIFLSLIFPQSFSR